VLPRFHFELPRAAVETPLSVRCRIERTGAPSPNSEAAAGAGGGFYVNDDA
jgi:hypothetical protein